MKKRTTTTKRERDPIYARARELIKLSASGESNFEAVALKLRSEFNISEERANQAAARAARIRRHAIGTPPNTSLVLTPDELEYCEERGGKSSAIHAALDVAMKRS